MTDAPEGWIDSDLWPCGLVVMDGTGQIQNTNATLRRWLGMDTAGQCQSLRFVDILSRASRIYFETHLRPLLLTQRHFSEISIELERPDGARVGVFINGSATLSDGHMVSAHFSILQNERRQTFERELVAKRRESDEFKSLVRSSPHAIISVDMKLIIRAWNPASKYLFGYAEAEAIGQRFDLLLVPPEDAALVADDLRGIVSGDTVRSETERLHKDGSRIPVERSIAAIHDNTQGFSGFVATYSDISARKKSEAQVQTLLQEINHRSKNLLAVVQVIARQTGRLYDGADFLTVFTKRLASLTSNQEILISSRGNHVDLDALARAQFAHLIDPADTRVTIGGPTVRLNESASQAVGMAIFELVTNAAKYGALSQESGAVALSWVITDGASPSVDISWIETDGPPVKEPTRKGFGFQVTGPILESTTSGMTSRAYTAKGFCWSLVAPYDQLT